jgi:pimeloyl-ACP methyl ester carboxylesterase
MFERIPTAEIHWFPDAGHTLPIEEPEAVVDAIEEWRRRRVASPA